MTVTFLPSPYHTSGRQGAKIDSIVLHWMDGTLANTDAEFTRGSRRVSAHYGIEGAIVHQYVRDADTAWHAGDWTENTRSIGIEHSAQPGRDATATTIATSVALIVGLCRKYSISPDHIYPHKRFYPTACPGTLPIAAMVAAVRAQLTTTPTPTPEVDMTPAEQDAIAIKTAIQVWQRFTVNGLTLQAALSRLVAASDPAALAAAVAKAMPATSGTVTQAQLEAALRTVLGSVDNVPK